MGASLPHEPRGTSWRFPGNGRAISHVAVLLAACIGVSLLLALLYGDVTRAIPAVASACILLWIADTDLRTLTIPNRLILLGVAVVVPLNLAYQALTVSSMLLGAGLCSGTLLLPYVAFRGQLGAGDVKLGGLAGLMLGFPVAAFALGTAALLLVVSSERAGHSPGPRYLPLGALLGAAAMVAIFTSAFVTR